MQSDLYLGYTTERKNRYHLVMVVARDDKTQYRTFIKICHSEDEMQQIATIIGLPLKPLDA